MIAEIICVGTELLMGQIVNTNAKYISQRLVDLGVNMYHQSVVGDNPERLAQEISQAMSRSDIIIMTGGLGPTKDDLTKETAARLCGLTLERHMPSYEALKARFEMMGKTMTPNNLKQADFPKEAIVLPNPNGTAPGCIMTAENGCRIALLPGPPRELVPMFESSIVPFLSAQTNQHMYTKVLHIYGLGESAVEYAIRDLIDAQTNPTIAPYADTGEMILRITADCKDDADGERIIQPVVDEICSRIGEFVYSTNNESLPEVCARLLLEQGKTLAIAESCTGGKLTSKLVEIPGCSNWLLEGVVTYSNQSKMQRLGVCLETLQSVGAVSEQAAKEMAMGMRWTSGADVALAVTGFAGPASTENEPVGLVYVALADKNDVWAYECHQTGNRERIRSTSVLKALDILRKYLLNNK